MNDEQSIISFLSRTATEYRMRGQVHDAALTLGVKAVIERLCKERDAAQKALEKIACQELSADMSVDQQLDGDFEGAYNHMIESARAALKGTEP